MLYPSAFRSLVGQFEKDLKMRRSWLVTHIAAAWWVVPRQWDGGPGGCRDDGVMISRPSLGIDQPGGHVSELGMSGTLKGQYLSHHTS